MKADLKRTLFTAKYHSMKTTTKKMEHSIILSYHERTISVSDGQPRAENVSVTTCPAHHGHQQCAHRQLEFMHFTDTPGVSGKNITLVFIATDSCSFETILAQTAAHRSG